MRRIGTNDLSLEINTLVDKLDSTDIEDTEHINFVNRNPNNKSKPSFKKYCQYCHKTNHSISSCFTKKNEMMNIIKIDTQDQNHHNKHLFNISKENQIKKIIKKHLITIITKEIAIEVIPYGRSRQNLRNNSRNNRYNSRSNSRPRYSQYPNRSYSPYQSRSRYDNY